MTFITDVIKSLMAKGLTRKEAKKIFNRYKPEGVSSSVPSHPEGMTRQVARQRQRQGGHRRASY